MRVCYALLAIATTLLVGGEAATASGQTQLSKVTSVDSVQATGRFLRSHRTIEEEDDEDSLDGFDEEEEERKPLFDAARLDAALKNNTKMSKLFKRWSANNYSATEVAAKIGVDVNGAFNQKYSNLYMGYLSHLKD
ncbi:hypothetical protein PRNP1_005366 [Phytophthora ramorum]